MPLILEDTNGPRQNYCLEQSQTYIRSLPKSTSIYARLSKITSRLSITTVLLYAMCYNTTLPQSSNWENQIKTVINIPKIRLDCILLAIPHTILFIASITDF